MDCGRPADPRAITDDRQLDDDSAEVRIRQRRKAGVAGCGVRMRCRGAINSPLAVSTGAPLMPVPPMSMPSRVAIVPSFGQLDGSRPDHVPALFLDTGEKGWFRFTEFFTARIW